MEHSESDLVDRLRVRRLGLGSRVFGLLRNPFFFLFAGVVLFVFQRAEAPFAEVLAVGAAVVLAATFLDGLTRPNSTWHWTNEALDDRVRHLVNLLGMARSNVVFVTGCLHHTLFEREEVVRAIKRLPKKAKLKVYFERSIDESTKNFVEAVQGRCEFIPILPGCMPHGAVVDSKHCKVEEFGVSDAAENKHVDYYAYDPERAREMLQTIERVAKASAASFRTAQRAS